MVRAEDEARDVVPALDKEQRRGAAVAEIEGGHFPAWKWRKSSFGDTELEPRPRQTCKLCLTFRSILQIIYLIFEIFLDI